MKYTYTLTEEISRWSFEVHIQKKNRFWIAFTNPTAGPWKRIESHNKEKIRGEVYRFDREEKRPDIILINDYLKTIIIIEAKDNLEKLNKSDQINKSCEVTYNISKMLKNLKNNKFWLNRHSYKIINGLLWGSLKKSNMKDIKKVFQNYQNAFKKFKFDIIEDGQIGIETIKNSNEKLSLNFYGSLKNNLISQILNDLK